MLRSKLGLLVVMLLCVSAVHAENDHDVARRAVERGELLPLSKILQITEREYPGRVLEVELDREEGRFFYEIEILLKDGRVIELTYDGETGELLESEVED